jgi:hypothetical protein
MLCKIEIFGLHHALDKAVSQYGVSTLGNRFTHGLRERVIQDN